MSVLRTGVFYFVWILATLTHATLSLFTFVFPLLYRYKFIALYSRFIIYMAKVICKLNYEVHGKENLPSQASIILSNHQSTWETLAYQFIFPPQSWVVKKQLLYIPFFGWAFALLQPIAINRNQKNGARDQLFRQGKKQLKEGRWLVIFPEGTRASYGNLKPFAKGGAALSEKTGFSVVPVAHNAGKFWVRHAFVIKPGTIHVWIGKAIDPIGLTAAQINANAHAFVHAKLKENNDEEFH